jgi:hypothetical protein
VEGSTTTLDFEVSTRRYRPGEPAAAAALWAVCSATVSGSTSPVPERVGSHWRAWISPAIGEHGTKGLVGCLEDATIDRVQGDVLTLGS